MAERKLPEEVAHVPDESAVDEPDKRTTALEQHEFDTYVRGLKTSDLGAVRSMQTKFLTRLRDIGVDLDEIENPAAVVQGIPDGSDQKDYGTLFKWVSKITADDVEAVRQLISLAATAGARIGGR